MKPAQFQIVYDGSALETHEINVNDLAPALLAIGELMNSVGNVLYGDKFKITVSVKGSFKTGSFGVEMIANAQSLLLEAIDLFNGANATAVLNAAGLIGLGYAAKNNLIGFLLWLKNRKITKKESIGSDDVRIYIGDEQYEISNAIWLLYQDYKVRKSLDDLISKPLSGEGIDSFAVFDLKNDNKEPLVFVEREQSSYFVAPVLNSEEINDQVVIMSLQIISISFAEGNKWRFSDGERLFYADVLDDSFLHRVQNNQESFSKDDLLKVKMRIRQWRNNKGMKTDYSVMEVIEHQTIKQLELT